jgi:hypothetical protein
MLPLLTQAAQHRGCTSHSCIASAAYSPVLGVQNTHEPVVPKAIRGVMKLVASTTRKLQGNHQQVALVILTLPDYDTAGLCKIFYFTTLCEMTELMGRSSQLGVVGKFIRFWL